MAEDEPVLAPDADFGLVGEKSQAERRRDPPPLEQCGGRPGQEHQACRSVEGARCHELAVGRPFDRRGILLGDGFCLIALVHGMSPSV